MQFLIMVSINFRMPFLNTLWDFAEYCVTTFNFYRKKFSPVLIQVVTFPFQNILLRKMK